MRVLKTKLSWLNHCFKGICLKYHRQLVPLFDLLIDEHELAIDVGAHSGQFTKHLAQHAALVLAIEPAAYPLSILRIVKRFRRLQNVRIIAAGVGETEGLHTLHTPLKASGVPRFGLASMNPDRTTEDLYVDETVTLTTVDNLIDLYGENRRCCMIKADIEGFEYAMLSGAERVIAQHRPACFMEISDDREAITDFLKSHGYRLFDLTNYNGKGVESLRIQEQMQDSKPSGHNILAIHETRHADLAQVRGTFCDYIGSSFSC